ncbi:unnamed protein product [Bursaphelenchus okinawaensis]|uniref:Uncharacterized protein n=1 Tax=Bursaphelenchus okinawaensis TaxID=465554 RepID=A0A811KRP5_9BILA|nr:unnamed protein product [Bursaphelenchus okinawaensis]CAG9112377.1 unnamed protein product [Bursaphelenchus okinawaensis]
MIKQILITINDEMKPTTLSVLLLTLLFYYGSAEVEPLFTRILWNVTMQDVLNLINAFQSLLKAHNFEEFKQKLETSDPELVNKVVAFRQGLDSEMADVSEQAKDFSDRIIIEITRLLPPPSNFTFDLVSAETHISDLAEMYLNLDSKSKKGIDALAPHLKVIFDWLSTQIKTIHMYVKNPLALLAQLPLIINL